VFAEMLGRGEESEILTEILDQETMADEKLSSVAETSVNPHAANGTVSS
jgi:ferritin-like metal-binding protein YciE